MPYNSCYIIDGGGTALYAGFQSVFLKKIKGSFVHLLYPQWELD